MKKTVVAMLGLVALGAGAMFLSQGTANAAPATPDTVPFTYRGFKGIAQREDDGTWVATVFDSNGVGHDATGKSSAAAILAAQAMVDAAVLSNAWGAPVGGSAPAGVVGGNVAGNSGSENVAGTDGGTDGTYVGGGGSSGGGGSEDDFGSEVANVLRMRVMR